VHRYAVIDSKCYILLCIARDLGKLDKEFLISASKGLSLTITLYLVSIKSYIATVSLISYFLTASKMFTLIIM
jgi:hypothetical protein